MLSNKFYISILLFLAQLTTNLQRSSAHTLIEPDCHSNCTPVSLQTDPPVNLTEYMRASWYIQQQQLTGYQRLRDLYCVTATYNRDQRSKVPFFHGQVISVYNYANRDGINGPNENNNQTVLCARVANASSPEKLLVGPCFLPNIFGGPYYILAAGPQPELYEWAIVIGGQPTVNMGNNTCTTSEDKINNSGLWLLSRTPQLAEEKIEMMKEILLQRNVSTQLLKPVVQEGCQYEGAFLKF